MKQLYLIYGRTHGRLAAERVTSWNSSLTFPTFPRLAASCALQSVFLRLQRCNLQVEIRIALSHVYGANREEEGDGRPHDDSPWFLLQKHCGGTHRVPKEYDPGIQMY